MGLKIEQIIAKGYTITFKQCPLREVLIVEVSKDYLTVDQEVSYMIGEDIFNSSVIETIEQMASHLAFISADICEEEKKCR